MKDQLAETSLDADKRIFQRWWESDYRWRIALGALIGFLWINVTISNPQVMLALTAALVAFGSLIALVFAAFLEHTNGGRRRTHRW